jgi:predicted TIM-barrel fold metal-dependent hydrolase
MLYLPITDPQFSVRMIDEFAGHPSVAGFAITALNYLPLHRNEYMKVFAALNERGLPLAVHATHNWLERPFNIMPRFLAAHAVGTPFYGMVHLFNAIIAGLPERFPRIRWIWREAGQSWLTFTASRLDNEYKQRTSEAPLLTRLPSEYIRDMFFATQPLEREFPSKEARTLFDYVNGSRSFVYSSGYPGHDFDTPAAVWDLDYLTEDEKRAVLAGNALRLFDFKVRDRAGA